MEKEDVVLSAFANAFRTPDLRRKLLFVLMIITLFRLGSQVPAPGVNVANVQTCLDSPAGGATTKPLDLRCRQTSTPFQARKAGR